MQVCMICTILDCTQLLTHYPTSMNSDRFLPSASRFFGFVTLAFLILGALLALFLPWDLFTKLPQEGIRSLLVYYPKLAILLQFGALTVAFLAFVFFRKTLDKNMVGLFPDGGKAALRQGLWGAGVGAVMALLLLVISFALGILRFKVNPEGWSILPLYSVFFLLVALEQELLLRGYLLKLFSENMQPWKALLTSTLLISLFQDPGEGSIVLGGINLLLSSILLGLVYLHFKSIWAAVGLHFSWYFLQGLVMGFKVGKGEVHGLLIPVQQGHADWISGGVTGMEGSIITAILYLGVIGWVYFTTKPELVAPKKVEAVA